MCIFGYASQWRAFESKWLKILANHHFALSDFHATELLDSQRHQPMLKQVAVRRVALIGICSIALAMIAFADSTADWQQYT